MQGSNEPQWPDRGGYRAGLPQLGGGMWRQSPPYSEEFSSACGTRPPALWQAQGAVSRLWRGRFKMRRREFITLVGGAMAWPLAAQAQQRAFPVIGLLSSRSPDIDTPLISVIRQALSEKGLVEGQNVALDYRWAEGQYDRLAKLAAELVRQQVGVIVTMGGEPAALAAKAATTTIPIVFVGGSDPIRVGLVTNVHRPGGNITGVSMLINEMEPKRLELLGELRPQATTVAVLVNKDNPISELHLNDIQTAARNVAREISILNASTIRDIDAAFATLTQMRTEALFVVADPFFFTRAAQPRVLV